MNTLMNYNQSLQTVFGILHAVYQRRTQNRKVYKFLETIFKMWFSCTRLPNYLQSCTINMSSLNTTK